MAGLDGAAVADFTDLLGSLQGNQFTISAAQMAALAGGTLADGPHVLHLRAADPAGNVSNIDVAFTLDTSAPAGSANLAPGSATVSSTETSAASVTLVGLTEPGAQVTLGSNGPVTTANKSGAFQFTNVALALGSNSVALHIVDRAGNASDINASITRDAATAAGDMVTTWDQNTLAAIATDASQATVASRTLAMEASAVYDAVNAIDGVNGLFVTMHAAAGASIDAAVAAAAESVLASIYPAQAGALATKLAASLNTLPAGQSRDDGFSLGMAIGNAIVTLRSNDHSQDFVAFTPGSGPGVWIPTGPAFMPAVNPNWPLVTPFIISGPAAYLPSGPPALSSQQWVDEYNETKDLGAADSTMRTADETQIARFWADGQGLPAPPGIGTSSPRQWLRPPAAARPITPACLPCSIRQWPIRPSWPGTRSTPINSGGQSPPSRPAIPIGNDLHGRRSELAATARDSGVSRIRLGPQRFQRRRGHGAEQPLR